ncbi:hypothetical protein [Mycolicibacterium sp.]|uniref:hypothetical protein n=1 Tax=Mycolicibacterium sp. TaxID=2320850 RepID=UPI0035609E39
MPDMYTETVPASDLRQALAASTHYVAEYGIHVMRITDHTGQTHNFTFDAAPFEHMRTMIENSIIEAHEAQ